jgi:hypothetical protein
MGGNARRRGYAQFAAKQMNIVTEIAQPFRCLEEIPLGAAIEIEPFMNQSDFHQSMPSRLCRGVFSARRKSRDR